MPSMALEHVAGTHVARPAHVVEGLLTGVVVAGLLVPASLRLLSPGDIELPLLGSIAGGGGAYRFLAAGPMFLAVLVAAGCWHNFVLPTAMLLMIGALIQSSASHFSRAASCGCFGSLEAPPIAGAAVGAVMMVAIGVLWSMQSPRIGPSILSTTFGCMLFAGGIGAIMAYTTGGESCQRAVAKHVRGALPDEHAYLVVLLRCGCARCEAQRVDTVGQVVRQRELYPRARVVAILTGCDGSYRTGHALGYGDVHEILVGKGPIVTNCAAPQILIIE